MTYPVYRQAAEPRLTNVLAWEHDYQISRKTVQLAGAVSGERTYVVGQVVGRRTKDDEPTITPGTNTGTGTVGSLSLGPAAKVGIYRLTCVATATNAGRFQVVDPAGRRLADALVGVAYSNADLAFTIADGTPDFAVGDSFAIEVEAGDGKVVPIDFTADDGSQDAYGFVVRRATVAEAGTADGLVIVRDAVVVASGLVWPEGATAGQKAAALAQLEQARIYTREEA